MSLKELFRIKNLPVFQNKMFLKRADAIDCTKGDVILVQNTKTGLIYNSAFDPSLMQYDDNYQNEQAYSDVFQKHLCQVKSIIERCFISKSFIEIGCGKGYFLEYMSHAGYDVIGFDPTYEGQNPNVIKKYFEPSLGFSADSIVLRHVLEHVVDPYAFLSTIAKFNGNKGYIYIEVPCLDWICKHHAWFDIFYEHVNYFRSINFERMFDTVVERGHLFGGQYLYVVADLATLKEPIYTELDAFSFPNDFLSNIQGIVDNAKSQTNVIWGGASKGVIFSLYMQRAGVDIDYVIDINPAKQGKYLGVSGLIVSSPNEVLTKLKKRNNIFVMNSNYLEEVIELSDNQFNYTKVD